MDKNRKLIQIDFAILHFNILKLAAVPNIKMDILANLKKLRIF